MSDFTIKTNEFEGPLSLLLQLIEERKLLINNISLTKVTDEFLQHVEKLQEFSIGAVADFISVASTLILIKSKSLLPTLDLSTEEEGDIKDLEERLRLFQKMRDLSEHVANLFGKNPLFEKPAFKINEPIFSPDRRTTVSFLHSLIGGVLENLPKTELVPKALVRKVVSLEEMMGRLLERVKKNLQMSFKEFSKGGMGATGKGQKVDVIVTFLAMLELVKQGVISVTQHRDFEDITLQSAEVGLPHYT